MSRFTGRTPKETGTNHKVSGGVGKGTKGGYSHTDPKSTTGRRMKEKAEARFNLLLLVGSLVGGAIGCAIAYLLMSAFYATIPNVLLFALMMAIVGLGVMGGASISAGRYKIGVPQALSIALVGALLMGVLGGVLEFIYELRFTIKLVPVAQQESTISLTDYIFCIDDSGSMYGNDANNQRDAAMLEMLDTIDPTSQVGLIRYNGRVKNEEVVFAALLTEEQKELLADISQNHENDGDTNFEAPLKAALNQFKEIDETGRRPVVVLMSDGECGINTDKWIEAYNKAGVTICAIYLGLNEDIPEVLTTLADGTNGIVLNADDADQLVKTFNIMVQQTNSSAFGIAHDPSYRRFLLNRRRGADRWNPVAMVERIVFFALLGLLLGFLLYREMDSDEHLKGQMFVSTVMGLACGVAVELGFLLGMGLLNRATLILFAIVPANYAMFRGGFYNSQGGRRRDSKTAGNDVGGKAIRNDGKFSHQKGKSIRS